MSYRSRPELTTAQNVFLFNVKTQLENIEKSFIGLSCLWLDEYKHNIDLNDALGTLFPFEQSFDDLALKVREWVEDSVNRLDTLQPEIQSD